MYRYALYGLQIASAIECPELYPGEISPPDVVFRFGQVTKNRGPAQSIVARAEGDDGFLLDIPGVASFRIASGNEITIDRDQQAEDAAVRLFLLGSACGALLHQRGITPFHGSAIALEQGAVIFAGPQGHGKSTLAGAFVRQGYPMLSDDVCALTLDGDRVLLHPAFPRLNLLPDALARLAVAHGEENRQPFTGKHLVSVDGFSPKPQRLVALYELQPAPVDAVTLHPLFGYAKLAALMGNTYRVQFAQQMGHTARHFAALQQIAQRVRVARIQRPQSAYLLDELVDAIHADSIVQGGMTVCPTTQAD